MLRLVNKADYIYNWIKKNNIDYGEWFGSDEWSLVDDIKRDLLADKYIKPDGHLDAEKMVYDAKFHSKKPNNNNNNNNKKESKNNMNFNMFGNVFGDFFKPVANGYAKMGANGKVAIKTNTGYKTFDIDKMKLINCDSFAFDMDGAFWVVPTFKVERGDIILVNNKPRCVIEVKDKSIRTFSYENSTIDEIVPEHHVFMGKTYCYGKIFSPFMNMDKSDNMMTNMMNMAMMSQMFNGGNNSMNGFNPMMMMFMMNSGSNPFMDMFEGAFSFGEKETADTSKKEE